MPGIPGLTEITYTFLALIHLAFPANVLSRTRWEKQPGVFVCHFNALSPGFFFQAQFLLAYTPWGGFGCTLGLVPVSRQHMWSLARELLRPAKASFNLAIVLKRKMTLFVYLLIKNFVYISFSRYNCKCCLYERAEPHHSVNCLEQQLAWLEVTSRTVF